MDNKFLNSVEIAEQECCWDLLELPMIQSSVKVEFISTCPPDDKSVHLPKIIQFYGKWIQALKMLE